MQIKRSEYCFAIGERGDSRNVLLLNIPKFLNKYINEELSKKVVLG